MNIEPSASIQGEAIVIPARDGFSLAAMRYQPAANPTETVVVINAATAVPQRFYRAFATFLAAQGYTVITYDYRGIGGSRPVPLPKFVAYAREWALLDMAGVLDWVQETYAPRRLFAVGHSFGGQTIGLVPNNDQVDALVTMSAQSGYWRYQRGIQVLLVALHMYFTMPAFAHVLGYVPLSKLGMGEDLPKGVALEWASWCRSRGYLLDDATLPLERFQRFQAPVLAFSFADDDWGTCRAVDAMMRAYPRLTRRHIDPAAVGLKSLGHFGFFRAQSAALWPEVVAWLEEAAPCSRSDSAPQS